jgi:hypothetical protein
MLRGVRLEPARALFARARPLEEAGLALVVLPSNIPAIAVQSLLPALALRRPVLFKCASAEPWFTPAFLGLLIENAPQLGSAYAALTWRGGTGAVEEPLLGLCERVLVYGDAETLRSFDSRAPGKVIGYGPKVSLAAISRDADLEAAARGLATDVALFDQRGCLSVQAVYAEERGSRSLADALAASLLASASSLPPGAATLEETAGVQHLRLDADLRGLYQPLLPIDCGTVVVDDDPRLRPSPGRRTVRVIPLPDLNRLPAILAPWQGRLQGIAFAGQRAWSLQSQLVTLGATRFAAPGDLQNTDALWWNGGIDPLVALGGSAKEEDRGCD